jgi:hypothetical protein
MPWMASMAPCLHIPIVARDREAIERYVGTIVHEINGREVALAFVVTIYQTPTIDHRLPVWNLAEAEQLHTKEQVWVHVECRHYRQVFRKALPQVDLTERDVDHVMNREIARLKGFPYIRLVPITAAANRSSGALVEKWGIAYHRSARMREVNRHSRAQVQYADIADIVKMLNISTGGGVMGAVNEAQALFEMPRSS